MIEYQLIRSSRRKSIALQIKSGEVTVRAPQGISQDYIEQLIHNKRAWIDAKLHAYQHSLNSNNVQANILQNDGQLWLKGVLKKITVTYSNKSGIEEFDDVVIVHLKNNYRQLPLLKQNKNIQKVIEVWLKEQATFTLDAKLAYHSELTQLFPQSFKVRQYKARWGSCNSRGELAFNYLLMLVPDFVVDYVVIHELCHLRYLNHGAKFWQLVASFYPQYHEAKQWLKLHQQHLNWPKN